MKLGSAALAGLDYGSLSECTWLRHLRLGQGGLAEDGLVMEQRDRGKGRLSDLGDGRVRYLRLLLTGRSIAIMNRCILGMMERCGLGMIERQGLGGVGLLVRRLELLLPGCILGRMERCGLAGGRVCDLGEGRLRPLGLGLVSLVECGRNLLLVDGKTGTAVRRIVRIHDVEMAETVNNLVSLQMLTTYLPSQ